MLRSSLNGARLRKNSFSWFKILDVKQRAKRAVSDSPGLVDFDIALVNLVVNLPDGQVIFFEEFE